MAHWLLVCARNRLAAVLALAIVAAGVGAIAVASYRFLGAPAGIVVGAAASLALILLVTTHPRLEAWAERMAAEERALNPRPRL